MIASLQVRDFRGVRTCDSLDVAPLTLLVGPNGAGKSSIIEALAIGAGHQPGEMVGRVVRARGGWNGARYLVRSADEVTEAEVTIGFSSRPSRTTRLRFDEAPVGLSEFEVPQLTVPTAVPFSAIEWSAQDDDSTPQVGRTVFVIDNHYRATSVRGLGGIERVELIHPAASRSEPLWRDLADAARRGRLEAVQDHLRAIIGPRFRSLQDFRESEDGSHSNVCLVFSDGMVPVAVAGDGLRSLVRLALQLAARPGSVMLLEEPEVHQHPAAIWLTARLMLEAVVRDVQIVATTHSIELIDALVQQATPADLDRMQLVQVSLSEGGEVQTHPVPGPQVATFRDTLAEDLR